METLSKLEYARHRGVSPAMVTRWLKGARIALAPDGKRVDVARSDEMLRVHRDPSRGGRQAGIQPHTPSAEPPVAPPTQPPVAAVAELSATASFTMARTARERIAAEMAQLALEERRGTLVLRADVERAIEDAMASALARLDALSVVLPPKLAGASDVRDLQNAIDDEISGLRQEMSDTFAAMLGGGPRRQ